MLITPDQYAKPAKKPLNRPAPAFSEPPPAASSPSSSSGLSSASRGGNAAAAAARAAAAPSRPSPYSQPPPASVRVSSDSQQQQPSPSARTQRPSAQHASNQGASHGPQGGGYGQDESAVGGGQQDAEQEEEDINGQAVEILAGLTSLGISQALRDKVQDAIRALDQASASAAGGMATSPTGSSASGSVGNAALGGGRSPGGSRGPGDRSLERQVEALEKKLSMSRNIMRKLYHKNVHLEKELELLKTNALPAASLDMIGGGRLAGGGSGAGGVRPATSGGAQLVRDNPVAQAMQERDNTILQLQHALDASRRRCALLEAQAPGSSPGGGAGGGGTLGRQQQQGIREVLAQSALHLSKYQQIRDDYNRLLYKRTSAVSTSKAASQHARALVDEMQSRLAQEIQEREAEAALYSARLYESERQMSDWYVEKRVLEQNIARLNDEVAQRDRIDAEMETCICSMFERLKLLEETNGQLTARLEAAGLSVEARPSGPGGAGGTNVAHFGGDGE